MKPAYLVLIRDVKKGAAHLEAIPHLFDSPGSVTLWAENGLNELVTVIVQTVPVQVEDDVKLASWV